MLDVPRILRLSGPLALATMGVVACSDDRAPTASAVLDSAGVTIVRTGGDELAALPEWTLGEPRVVLGSPAGGPAHQFSHIVGGFLLADGSILIGDEQTRELRVFSATGRPLRTFGGEGEGPGEVTRFLLRVERGNGDTVLVSGWPFGTLSRFTAAGAYVGSLHLGPFWPGRTSRILPDGTILLDFFDGGHGNNVELWAARGEEPTFRPRGALVRAHESGRLDTLRLVNGELFFKTGLVGRDLWVGAVPFGPVTITALAGARVFVGETHRAEIEIRRMDGTLETLIRWEDQPTPVRAADRDRFERETLERMRRPDRAPFARRWLAAVPYPEWKPPFSELVGDVTGAVWIRLPTGADDPRDRWIVFGPDGRARARIRPPAESRFLQIGLDHALLVRSDDLDVERVELRPLQRR